MKKAVRASAVLAVIFAVLASAPKGFAREHDQEEFPLKKEADICRVWEWQVVKETVSRSAPTGLFTVRYHRAPEEDRKSFSNQ